MQRAGKKRSDSLMGFGDGVPCLIFADMHPTASAFDLMNQYGKEKVPFLFLVDFSGENASIFRIDKIDPNHLLFNINGLTNNLHTNVEPLPENIHFEVQNLDFEAYENAFNTVMYHLRRGDSYLLNLTFPVRIDTNLSLKQIFDHSKASYKLWMKERLTVFSPEPFIRINGCKIFTYPMKGTIDANLPNAEELLLNDPKERAEHFTIVDLLRNDLNMVSEKVRVEQFRYVQEIKTLRGKLLQTSSLISGELSEDWTKKIGTILSQLLPAGSISGAPKKRTVEIIREVETYDRGFYTGVFGVFDGEKLDSGVMIRYIEKSENQFVFKAGGGITVNSELHAEYNELMQKVVLPFGRL